MQLPEPISLGDIDDIEGFVNATLNASGIDLQAWERDDLVAEGLVILCELWDRFEPHRPGYQQAGRFSGFAAFYLPKKLGDAWHRSRPEHRYVTDTESGKRRWQFFKAHTSLEGVAEGGNRTAADGSSFSRGSEHAEAEFLHGRYWVPVAQAA